MFERVGESFDEVPHSERVEVEGVHVANNVAEAAIFVEGVASCVGYDGRPQFMFAVIVVSGEVGVAKPDPQVFAHAVDGLQMGTEMSGPWATICPRTSPARTRPASPPFGLTATERPRRKAMSDLRT